MVSKIHATVSSINVLGVLHHIIVRGINRCAILKDNFDLENFLERVSVLFPEIQTICYAWILMDMI